MVITYSRVWINRIHRVSPEFTRSNNDVPLASTRESTGSGPVVFKVVPVPGAAFSGTVTKTDETCLCPIGVLKTVQTFFNVAHTNVQTDGRNSQLKHETCYVYFVKLSGMAISPTGGVFSYLPHHLDLASENSVGHSTCMSVLARRRVIIGSIVQPKRSCLGAATGTAESPHRWGK